MKHKWWKDKKVRRRKIAKKIPEERRTSERKDVQRRLGDCEKEEW